MKIQKKDHKVILKCYEYFSKNSDLKVKKRSLLHDLKFNEHELRNILERLRKMNYLENKIVSGDNWPYQLSEKGLEYSQKHTKSFFEKITTNKVLKWLFGVVSFIVVYLLGLFTDEIKLFLETSLGN